MSSENRTLTWWESAYDARTITKNNWNFQIAHAVSSGDAEGQANVVWKSKAVAPFTRISWKEQYALNWTATFPTTGTQITISGVWQPCNKGQAFDLNKYGFWDESKEPAKEDWIKVGKINYKYPGVPGIHIVVGVLDASSKEYNPIFIDTTVLGPGSSAVYQPQGTVSWWLEGGNLTGQIYTGTFSPLATEDFSKPAVSTNKHEWWTTFLFDSFLWLKSATAPSMKLVAPFQSEAPAETNPVEILLDPFSWAVLLEPFVPASHQSSVEAFMLSGLRSFFDGLEVQFRGSNGKSLNIRYNARRGAEPGSIAAMGILASDSSSIGPKDLIDRALMDAVKAGKLPRIQTWRITPLLESAESENATHGGAWEVIP